MMLDLNINIELINAKRRRRFLQVFKFQIIQPT
jgi:hypothetical protein